jgi:predicted dehydrogenase
MGDITQLNGVGGHAAKFGDFLAVCDVDATHCERARTLAGGKSDCYEDYRHVLERNDIDAVTIVTPDHWHTPMAVAAMRAGKDVYCEKPLTLTVDEGKLICKVVQETGRVFQVGTQQRSEFDLMFLQAVAIAHAGRVGAIRRVTVAIGAGPASGPLPVVDPPKGLNWDFWLGPAPYADYRYKEADPSHGAYSRCHFEFRWWYDYSGGKLTDWGAHHVDIAQWAMKLDQTGPVRVEPLQSKFPVPFKDGYPTLDDQYNTPIEFHVKCTYANGAELIIRHNASDLGFDNGILIEGTEGRFFVNRERLTGKPVEQLAEMPLPEGTLSQLYKGKKPGNHMGNFVECLRTREQPISDVFSHHRAMTTCHLANIALRLNRPIQWNPDAEKIEGDEQAATFLYRTPRNGYPMPT